MNEIKDLINALGACKKGPFSFVAVTEKKAIGKGRTTKLPCADNMKTIKKVKATVVFLGPNYAKLKNAEREKEGLEPNYIPQESWFTPVTENMIIQKHKEKEKYYVYMNPKSNMIYKERSVYLDADNNIIKLEDFLAWQKEYESGYSDEKEPLVKIYHIEDIKYLKQGEFEFKSKDFANWQGLIASFKKW